MGTVRTLPTSTAGVRLADAAEVFLGTIPVANTRRGYAVVLDRLVRDFGADRNVALLDPDRVAGWFIFVWGGGAATTFNVRLAEGDERVGGGDLPRAEVTRSDSHISHPSTSC